MLGIERAIGELGQGRALEDDGRNALCFQERLNADRFRRRLPVLPAQVQGSCRQNLSLVARYNAGVPERRIGESGIRCRVTSAMKQVQSTPLAAIARILDARSADGGQLQQANASCISFDGEKSGAQDAVTSTEAVAFKTPCLGRRGGRRSGQLREVSLVSPAAVGPEINHREELIAGLQPSIASHRRLAALVGLAAAASWTGPVSSLCASICPPPIAACAGSRFRPDLATLYAKGVQT